MTTPIIGALPYVINPGDLVSAGPVMGDFNWIVSQVNANAGPGGNVFAYLINPLVYGADPTGGSDSTAAIQAAINVANVQGGGIVQFPPGKFALGAQLLLSDNVTLRGCGIGPYRAFSHGGSTVPTQSTFFITYQGAPAIKTTGYNASVEDLLFYYPNQVAPTAAAPIVYPATILSPFGTFACRRCTFINSYDAIDIENGNNYIEDCLIGAYHIGVNVDQCGDTMVIHNTNFGPIWDNFYGLAYPQNIDTAWALNNAIGIVTKRCDSVEYSNITMFSLSVGLLFTDSVVITPTNSFGFCTNINLDTVVTGIVAKSTRRLFGGQALFGGINVTNFVIVYNTIGPPSNAGVSLPIGGVDPPYLTLVNGTISNNFTNGSFLNNAGFLESHHVLGIDRPSQTVASPPVPATTVYTSVMYPYPVTVYITGGTYTNVAIQGPVSGFATGGPQSTIVLPPNSQIAITYTVAPTWVWFR